MKPLISLAKVGLTVFLVALSACGTAQTTPPAAGQSRVQKAQALFQEHCKSSGEFIKRTVDDVEGITLLKIRPKEINYSNQFKMDDPYGRDLSGDGYIESLIRGSVGEAYAKRRRPSDPPRIGYRYVEAIDPADGKRYRYTGRIDEPWRYDDSYSKTYKRFVLDKNPANGAAPRYGVTYDDISTHEDRELWIAGSSLKVIDLKTNEVIAERIGYMMDPGQGSEAGGRQAWLMAADYACPDFHRFPNPVVNLPGFSEQKYQTDDFVEKVLHPKQEK